MKAIRSPHPPLEVHRFSQMLFASFPRLGVLDWERHPRMELSANAV